MPERTYDLVIHQGSAVLPNTVEVTDIAIAKGRIVALAPNLLPYARRVIDATGKVVLPGMIDVHVHLNEPGLDWEGFLSGSQALAAGGCTTFFDMPINGVPPTISTACLQLKCRCARRQTYLDYGFWGGLVPGNLHELRSLADCGVVGFKAFMSSPGGPSAEHGFVAADDITLYRGMLEIAKTGRVLALHAESEPWVARLAAEFVRNGRTGPADYAQSRPVLAEVEAVERALLYAEYTGCPLHFVHISSAAAVARIQEAKRRGVDVSVETCPHYLALTDEDMARLGPVAKCAPPLRNRREQADLWEMVLAGRIDIIASDHSPCPMEMKIHDNFFEAWGGIAGGQSSVAVMVEEAHLRRGMPLHALARLLATNPARRFGLFPKKGAIQCGADADLVILDTNRPYVLRPEHLFQRHPHSPYIGRRLRVRVEKTLVRGQVVYDADRVAPFPDEPAGQWVKPAGSVRKEPSFAHGS
ncbi:allantoinase [Alicyclobacillus cellulosilyticus]|uniref:Allantoinase n=1 Tax=Alicyclobacillus cellulosilyticus TaxID=1003997 RepID=A0A917NLY0_9BACL|nr:allantoinase [Alicyclobacillus cellulosilyticus]GGJ10671.1 allantoinase [Alicyclobacillus cellulosilyticus]